MSATQHGSFRRRAISLLDAPDLVLFAQQAVGRRRQHIAAAGQQQNGRLRSHMADHYATLQVICSGLAEIAFYGPALHDELAGFELAHRVGL